MQKLLFAVAVLSAVLCQSSDGIAFDVKNRVMLSAQGGAGIPIGNFAADDTANLKAGGAKIGFGLGAAKEYGITEQFLIGGRLAYNRFGVKDDIFGEGLLVDANWSVLEYIGIHAKYLTLPGKDTRPHIRGGLFLGKAKFSADNADDYSHDSKVSVGLDAALGLTHFFSHRFGAGIESRFAHLFVSEDDIDAELAASIRRAQVHAPAGVRDPGGNVQWVGVYVYGTIALGE